MIPKAVSWAAVRRSWAWWPIAVSTPDDFAEWQALGAAGWGWDDVLPYYRRLEHDWDFDGALHGQDGPVPIRRTAVEEWAPLAKAVHQFAQERQIPVVADMNAAFRDGYGGDADMKQLAAKARLGGDLLSQCRSAQPRQSEDRRPRHGDRPVVRRDSRRRCDRNGGRKNHAILRQRDHCRSRWHPFAGFFDARRTPVRRASFRELGIDVRHDLPGVGKVNTISNHAILFIGLLQKPDARQSEQIRPHPMSAFRYSSGLPGAPNSDMYINVQCKTSWSRLGHQVANLAPSLLKPMARGRVSLASLDPETPPRVEFNFTGHELDTQRFMQGFRRCMEILAHDAVRAMTRLTFPVKFSDRLRRLNRITTANKMTSTALATLLDLVPPLARPVFSTLADRRIDLARLVEDDAALTEHIRDNVAGTFHPVGTCRMGAAGDRDAVTDAAGRVHGVAGLRVIDASIMPTITRGNTNIPTIMLAEKISDEMLRET